MKKIRQRSLLIFILFFNLSFQVKATTSIDSAELNKIQNSLKSVNISLNKLSDRMDKLDSLSKIAPVNTSSFSEGIDRWKKKNEGTRPKNFISLKVVFVFISILLLILFIWLSKKTALCRDTSYTIDSTGNKTLKSVELRPYSYSKVQCLWWTFIICTCYSSACIYFLDLLPLNSTAIILLGGSLAVTVFGKVIDNNQVNANSTPPDRHQDLNDHKDFFTDILSDENGVSVHRLQSLLFNFIFGIGYVFTFIYTIHKNKYPFMEFELWQFTLLGVSAAGYLGLKSGENSTSSKPARLIMAKEKFGLV